MQLIVIQRGERAEAAIGGVSKTSEWMINTAINLVADRYPAGEKAAKQRHMDHIFTDLWWRVFEGLNHQFVSRRGVSLHIGTDINMFFSFIVWPVFFN